MISSKELSNVRVLDTLFREHRQWLIRWLQRQCRTASPPEDLASDVFLALLQIPCLEAVRQPRAMMTTIARRLIYDARRHDRVVRAYEAELAILPEAAESSPEERLILVQALQAIDAMLAGLPPKAQAAFLLSQVDGLAYADIAAALKVSVSMVRKYVAKGLRAAYEARARQD